VSRKRQRIIAATVAVPAILALLASTAVLVADHFVARGHSPADKQRVAALEHAIKSAPSQVPALVAELDRQTKLSLRRVSRQKLAVGVLIVASMLFLGSIKWFLSLNRRTAPALSTITAMRARGLPRAASRGIAGATNVEGLRRALSSSASDARTSDADLSWVDAVVVREGRGPEAAIPILQAIQAHYGYLPDEALKRVCTLTEIKPAQIAGVSTFYAQFRRTPAGRHILKVCHGTACHVSGARQITEEIRRHLAIAPDADTDAQRMFTVDKVACLGCCSLAPVIMIDEQTVGRLTPANACEALDAVRGLEQPA